MKKIVYIQYTNPGGYPPLEHSARILSNKEWKVFFLGTKSHGDKQLKLEGGAAVEVRLLAFKGGGFFQKIHYLGYFLWVVIFVFLTRPQWIYASEYLISPLALLFSKLRFNVIYHEHDSPNRTAKGSLWNTVLLQFRKHLAHSAKLCILPNEKRTVLFLDQMGNTNVLTVWNCPLSAEVRRPRFFSAKPHCVGLYHGSIVPSRLPLTILDAMAVISNKMVLRIVGYETVGSEGYCDVFLKKAESLGLTDRVEMIGVIPLRSDLLRICEQCDFGLAMMPLKGGDQNMQHMTGASNKPFDYLACGLAVLVSNLPEWNEMYVMPGYGMSCNPQELHSIAKAFLWFSEHPKETQAMGEAGRQRILSDWNYEKQFNPVLDCLEKKPKALWKH